MIFWEISEKIIKFPGNWKMAVPFCRKSFLLCCRAHFRTLRDHTLSGKKSEQKILFFHGEMWFSMFVGQKIWSLIECYAAELSIMLFSELSKRVVIRKSCCNWHPLQSLWLHRQIFFDYFFCRQTMKITFLHAKLIFFGQVFFSDKVPRRRVLCPKENR